MSAQPLNDSTTLSYTELKRAQYQWKQQMALIDVVNKCGRSKSAICSIRGPY